MKSPLQPTAVLREAALDFYDAAQDDLTSEDRESIRILCHQLLDRRNSRFTRSLAAQYRRSSIEWKDLATESGLNKCEELAETLSEMASGLLEVAEEQRNIISLESLLAAKRIAGQQGVDLEGLDNVIAFASESGLAGI